jgi:hypothetical protein
MQKFNFLWRQSLTRIRIRSEKHCFESLDPDPLSLWGKKLDPDPHWNQYGSETLHSVFQLLIPDLIRRTRRYSCLTKPITYLAAERYGYRYLCFFVDLRILGKYFFARISIVICLGIFPAIPGYVFSLPPTVRWDFNARVGTVIHLAGIVSVSSDNLRNIYSLALKFHNHGLGRNMLLKPTLARRHHAKS